MPDIITESLQVVGRTAGRGTLGIARGIGRGTVTAGHTLMTAANALSVAGAPLNPASTIGRGIERGLGRLGEGVSMAFTMKMEQQAARKVAVAQLAEETGDTIHDVTKRMYKKTTFGHKLAVNSANAAVASAAFAVAAIGMSGPMHRSHTLRDAGLLQEQADRDQFQNYPGTGRGAGLGVDGDTVFAAHNLHGSGRRGRY